MKTVTIDYALYIEELQNAKEDGFNVIPKLKFNLQKILSILSNGYSTSDEMFKCRNELYDILRELDKVKKT